MVKVRKKMIMFWLNVIKILNAKINWKHYYRRNTIQCMKLLTKLSKVHLKIQFLTLRDVHILHVLFVHKLRPL